MSAPPKIAVVGMAWYRQEDWPALRELFVDADKLHTKWEDWQRSAVIGEHQARQKGQRVVRVEIRPALFAEWCSILGIPTDAAARARWVKEVTVRQVRQKTRSPLDV